MQARRILAAVVLVLGCQARPAAPALATKAVPVAPASSSTPVSAHVATSSASRVDLCKATPRATQRSTDVKPFSRPSGTCAGGLMCDVADVPPPGADACFVATTNIGRAESDMRASGRGAIAGSTTWSRERAPKYFDRVDAHLRLDDGESALLRKNGFVVLEREGVESYARAYHRIFQEQLPLYVSADSILHAVYAANEILLEETEKNRLAPRLGRMLGRMRATLSRSRALYDADTYADLDLYLAVADRLLRGEHDLADDASLIAHQAAAGAELAEVSLFGRRRMIDFTQYTPRGHYVGLEHYFRAMTWLSRLEFNLVSRSCRSSQPGAIVDPSETPREARDAIALADLASRSGALDDVRAFESVYSVFAGKRDDVSPLDLAAMAIPPTAADAPDRLKTKIGSRFRRTARLHFMPEGTKELPAIATFFGARATPDIAPLEGVVHDAVPERTRLGAADVGYVLGHDRALTYLKDDRAHHPSLDEALEKARRDLARDARGRGDVYGLWLDSVLRLGAPAEGHVPSFMKTDAFADARLASALAAYAQIRHTFVLLTGQGYDMYGCEIPDGFVEPALATYEGLLAWAKAARTIAPERSTYFSRVEKILGMLRDIARAELEGRALTEPQRRWLAMVSEYTPQDGYGGDSGQPPKYTGWYFDLFPDREIGASRDVALVADYFTLTNANEVRYLGVRGAALGVFVVDVGGEPRAMVGPVTLSYEAVRPITERLDDEAAKKLDSGERRAPWTASYLAPASSHARLPLGVEVENVNCAYDARVMIRSASDVGDVTVTLLDHHGDALVPPLTLPIHAGDSAIFAFELPDAVLRSQWGVEGVEVKAGDIRERL